jgi:hypothetical protein
MSNEFTLSNLRQIIKDSENGIEQMVTLIPLFPIEIINEYWRSVWLQEPSNPEDRWKSDWIRAILIAYSIDGSQPTTFRNGKNIKRSNKIRVGTWTEDENTLNLNDEWSHIPVKIINTLIDRLKIFNLKFDTPFYNYPTENIFTKWIESPCPIIHLGIEIDDAGKIPDDVFIKIENNISDKIKSLTIDFRSKAGSKTNYFKIRPSFLSRFIDLETFRLSAGLDKNQFFDLSKNKSLLELKIKINEFSVISGLSECNKLKEIELVNSVIKDFNFENKKELNNLHFNNIKLNENIIGNFTGNEIRIINSEIGEIINIVFINKLDRWGRYYNNFVIENTNTINKIILTGFISSINIKALNDLKELDINCSDSINELNITRLNSDFNYAHIKSESIGKITIENCKQKSLPIIKSNLLFKNDSKSGTDISIYNHDTKTLDGLEGIMGIKNIKMNNMHFFDAFFKSTHIKLNVLGDVSIENSSVKEINNINCFDNLTSLQLFNLENLDNIQGASKLTKLKELNLYRCKMLTSLEPLLELTELNELTIRLCESLKPKPKKVFLSGLELKKELRRYSKDKQRKNKFDSNYYNKFISLVESFNPEDIIQACALMNLFDENTFEQILYGVSYNIEKQTILLPSLPKYIQKYENEITILALKILISSKKLVNYPNIRDSINQININKSEIKTELNKLQIGNYELFRSIFKDLGELNELVNLKIIHINSLDKVDLIGIDKIENLEKVYLTNVKSLLSIDNLFKCNSLKELSISGTNENIIDFSKCSFKIAKLTLAGSFERLVNYNNIFSLEDLEIQSQNKLNLVFNDNLKKLKKLKLVGQFGNIDAIETLPSLEELIISLAKIDDAETFFNAINRKKVKKYSLGTFSFK